MAAENNKNRLELEALEPRRLLSAFWQGTDTDGDLIDIRLKGRGEMSVQTTPADAGIQIDSVTVAHTNTHSRLIVKAKPFGGDGVVDILVLDATGEDMGKIKIDGYLGDLDVGSIKQVATEGNLLFDDPQTHWNIDGDVNKIKVENSLEDITVAVTGWAKKVVVKGDMSAATLLVDGQLKRLNVWGSMLDNSTVSTLDRLRKLTVSGSIEQSNIESGAEINKVRVGMDILDSSIYAEWFMDRIIVDGGIDNSTIETKGDIGVVDVWNWIEQSDITAGPQGIGAILAYNISDSNITPYDPQNIYLDAYARLDTFQDIVVIVDDGVYFPAI